MSVRVPVRLCARALASCRVSVPPPCPTPAARPPPPCRAARPATHIAHVQLCHPPARTPPPPCEPAACTRRCDQVTPHMPVNQEAETSVGAHDREPRSSVDGFARDCVARRKDSAARARRLDYEREVREAAPHAPLAEPPAPYALGAERELARATDGRLYALRRHGARLTLDAPAAACRMDRARRDPCAHRPRVFLKIERVDFPQLAAHPRTPRPQTSPAAEPRGEFASDPCGPPAAERRDPSASGPRSPSASPPCRPRALGREGAGRLEARDWCTAGGVAPRVPLICRPPTVAERLRRRGPARRLHTSVTRHADWDECGRGRNGGWPECGRGRGGGWAECGRGRAGGWDECDRGRGGGWDDYGRGRGGGWDEWSREREGAWAECGRGRVVGGGARSGGGLVVAAPRGADLLCVRVTVQPYTRRGPHVLSGPPAPGGADDPNTINVYKNDQNPLPAPHQFPATRPNGAVKPLRQAARPPSAPQPKRCKSTSALPADSAPGSLRL